MQTLPLHSQKRVSLQRVAASTLKPHHPTTSKLKMRVIESDDESDSQKEVDEAEDKVVEDLLENIRG
jgi:restriction endonuclease Mrr